MSDESISGFYLDANTDHELRLDVDGHFPQMRASGTFRMLLDTVHWVAELSPNGNLRWQGSVVFHHPGEVSFPFTSVEIAVSRTSPNAPPQAEVVFSTPGTLQRTGTYAFQSEFFHTVEFEFDAVDGAQSVASIETHAHPDRPGDLKKETLTIEEVYRRAGFDVRMSTDPNAVVPLSLATSPGEPQKEQELWDDNELHDAMQTFWSRFSDSAQWAMWVFFARLHEADEPSIFNPHPTPEQLGGIMFDSIGPNERQGTAIFNDSFISQAPDGDPSPDAWVRRMRFWTAVHEMGHAFNLAHAWQKEHPAGTPWRPLHDDSEARSFMNYPFRVADGQAAFFRTFDLRFIDAELEFIRHAPESFVEMGNAKFFDHHGFRKLASRGPTTFQLELRVNREPATFEFLEPAVIELKLENTALTPKQVGTHVLSSPEELVVIVKKDGGEARRFLPYVRRCRRPQSVVLNPGAALYESLFVSAGRTGWGLAEPGNYTIQVGLPIGGEFLASNALRVRILPPGDVAEERLAQDYFSEEVGRVLTFDGSVVLDKANAVLNEVTQRFPKSCAAVHAKVALATPLARPYKRLELSAGRQQLRCAASAGAKIVTRPTEENAAYQGLQQALLSNPAQAAQCLGHVDFKYYADRFCSFLERTGRFQDAARAQQKTGAALQKRGVSLKPVLDQIDARRQRNADRATNK